MEQKRYYPAITALSEDMTEIEALDRISKYLRRAHETELTDNGRDLISGALKHMKIGAPNEIRLKMISITEKEYLTEAIQQELVGMVVELRPYFY